MKGKVFQAAAFIVLSILFYPYSASYAENKKLLRVGYTPLISQLPVIVSQNDDQFRLRRIEITMSKFNSFNSLEAALRVNAIDAAFIPVPMALRVAADDIPIKIVGAMSSGGSLLISKRPGDYSSLRSKVIGIPGLDSNENVRLKEIMGREKMRYGLDYKVIAVPFYTALDDLKFNRIDGFYFPEPYPTIALNKGYGTEVLNSDTDLGGGVMTVLVVREQLLINREAIKEWIKSMIRACRKLNNFSASETVENIIPFEFAPEIVEFTIRERTGGIDFGPVTPDISEIREYLEKTIDLKILFQSIAVDNLVDTSLLLESVNEERREK